MKIDPDKHCLCPECNEPMHLRVPIWIIPGESYIDTGGIDWESNPHRQMSNWHCPNCQECYFPLPNTGEDA